jgi:hypothetical protein
VVRLAGALASTFSDCDTAQLFVHHDVLIIMPRGVKKENLPSKVCVICNRPFNWRKKWERCWDEVTTCSKACNGARRQMKGITAVQSESHSSSSDSEETSTPCVEDVAEIRLLRKAAAKSAKAFARAKRECNVPAETGQKPCDMCSKGVDLLVRCQTDASQAWRMVCGKCWKLASGGQVDGDARHPHYRYGGLWKNRKTVASAGKGLDAKSIVKDIAILGNIFRIWKCCGNSSRDATSFGCGAAHNEA